MVVRYFQNIHYYHHFIFNLIEQYKAKNIKNKYLWEIDDSYVLDPTNGTGTLQLELSYMFGLIKVPTTLARINEPPEGQDCNVYSNVSEFGNVEIIAERDIFSNGMVSSIICK